MGVVSFAEYPRAIAKSYCRNLVSECFAMLAR